MEDLAAYVKRGGAVKLIAAQSWIDNPLGLKGFEEAYDFTLSDSQLVALSTGNTAEMLSALAKGRTASTSHWPMEPTASCRI